MKTAVIYARCSTEEQADRHLSIPAQLEECRKYASEHDYQIIAEYIDEGFSGSNIERPQFILMINDIRYKKIKVDAVLIWKFSRFSRDTIQSITYKDILRKQKTNVISITEPLPEDSPFSEIIERVIECIDALAIKIIREDTIRGMKHNARNGRWNGGTPPLGYRVEKQIIDGKERKVLTVDQVEAKTIKLIFDLYIKGWTLSSIAEELNRKGMKSKNNRPFTKTSFYSILTNPIYIGKYAWNRYAKSGSKFNDENEWVYSEKDGEKIIDNLTWEKAQDMINQRKFSGARTEKNEFWLSGLLYCEQCNKNLYVYDTHKGRKYYRCTSCYISVRKEEVEEAIERVIGQRVLSDQYYLAIERDLKKLETENKKELERLEKTKIEIEKKLYNLTKAVEGGLDVDSLKNRIVELNFRKNQIEEEIQSLSQKPQKKITKEMVVKEMKKWVENFRDAENPLEKKQFVKYIVHSIGLKPDKSIAVRLRVDERSKMIGAGSPTYLFLLLLKNRRYIFRN